MAEAVELVIVTMRFDGAAGADDQLRSVLANYTVLTRSANGIRNIDLMASVTKPGRYFIVEKWTNATLQRAHFDSAEMIDMAESCRVLLSSAPEVDLHEGLSTHDLL